MILGHRARREQAGFTVIELILGLGIFAVMASSVFLTYTNAVRIDRESNRISELTREGYWTLAALEEDLEKMASYHFPDNGQEDISPMNPVFSGEENSLRLLMRGPQNLQWVSYGLETPQGGTIQETLLGRRSTKNVNQIVGEQKGVDQQGTLLRRTAFFNGQPPENSDSIASEVLTKNIAAQGLSFSYAAIADPQQAELFWQDQWREEKPPAVVRIVVRLADGTPAPNMELTKVILLPVDLELTRNVETPAGVQE